MTWTWNGPWSLLSVLSTLFNLMVLCDYATSVVNGMLPSDGASPIEKIGSLGSKRSSESLDPTVPMHKRARLSPGGDRCLLNPPGWIHDLTQDGDVEPNPAPPRGHTGTSDVATLLDYLTWITGAPPDQHWAADGAPAFVSLARRTAAEANAGGVLAEIMTDARSLCTESSAARDRFSFLWEADPWHTYFNEAVAFFRWMLGLCTHVNSLDMRGGDPSLRFFIPLPAVRMESIVLDVIVPVIAVLEVPLISWWYDETEGGVYLATQAAGQDRVMAPSVACLTTVQLRRCLNALHEIATQRDFVIIDFVLDLLDGHAIHEASTQAAIDEASQKVRLWNSQQQPFRFLTCAHSVRGLDPCDGHGHMCTCWPMGEERGRL
eukprot:2113509-Amphidinium_carterae.2